MIEVGPLMVPTLPLPLLLVKQGQINTHLAAYMRANPPQAAAPANGAAPANPAGPSTVAAARPPAVRREYSAPVSASWFRYDSIHEMERTGAPDFFNGRSDSKTPKVRSVLRG